MASVKLKIKKSQTLADGKHPIIIQVIKNKKKAIASIGMRCSISQWNEKTNLPKNSQLAVICNTKLLEIQNLIFEGEKNNWTAKKIIEIFTGKNFKNLMLKDYYYKHYPHHHLMGSTITIHKAFFVRFFSFVGKDDIDFDDITFELLLKYKDSLSDLQPRGRNRYIQFIRRIYDNAIEYDFYHNRNYPFKERLKDTVVTNGTLQRNLNIEQVKSLFEYKDDTKIFRNNNKEFAVDVWRLMFLLRGINFIDLCLMKKEDIKEGYYIFVRQKLKQRSTRKQKVKIFDEAKEILKKYSYDDNIYCLPIFTTGYDFREDSKKGNSAHYKIRYHNVQINLRRVAKKLNITEKLTTMSARYTVINIAKNMEIPFLYLQELIGHSTNTTTDIYMDIFPQEKIDQYHRKVIDKVLK